MIGLPKNRTPRRDAELDRLENAASIAAMLHERMTVEVGDNDRDWPEDQKYAAFGGFPGWWCYMALCADVFNRSRPADEDWMAAVHWYADRVWNETFFNRGPLSRKQLECLMGFVVERVREKGGW
jgi:hypothetical protein